MSGVPEITEAEATTKNPALGNSTKTTTSNYGQTSHQDETSKQDLTNTVSYTPKQDSTNSNPQNEPPKQDSPHDNPQDIATPKRDSTNIKPQNDPPKQDSTDGNPQNGIPKQNAAEAYPNSKRDSTCLPLPGLFTPKGAKSQIKNLAGVPDNAYSKDVLARSIDAEIKYIKDEAKKLNNYSSQIDSALNEALDRLKFLKEDEDQDFRSLRDLQKAVTELKLQIPKQKADIDDKDPHEDHQAGTLKLK